MYLLSACSFLNIYISLSIKQLCTSFSFSSSSRISFFKYKFIYFNWRLITLQYCVGFAIYEHESAMGVHVFPILNPPPTSLRIPSLWVIPVHQPQASCILHRTWTDDSFLIRYYTCFNAILPNHPPPPPSPTESKRLFYTSVSLLLSRIQGCHYHISKFCIYALVYYIGVFLSGLHLLSYLGFSYLGRGVSLHCCSSKAQLLLTLDEGYLLTATLPGLECGVVPLGLPAPTQPLLLRHG